MFSSKKRTNLCDDCKQIQDLQGFCLLAPSKGTLSVRESISSHFINFWCAPHDWLVKNFWLHIILMHIWDLAMYRNPILFGRVYLLGRFIALRAGPKKSQFRGELSLCCDCESKGCFAIVSVKWAVPHHAPMIVGCCMLLCDDWAVPYHILMTVGCCMFLQAPCMVPWLRTLVCPLMTLGNTHTSWKISWVLSKTWCSDKSHVKTNTNLCLSRIPSDKN